MHVTLKHQPAFSIAVVRLEANEEIRVEPGAMVSYSEGMTTETRAEGGFLGGLKRIVGGESFFVNTWKAPAKGGEILLAPSLPGDLTLIDIGPGDFMLQSGAFVASEIGVMMDTSWGGAKGFFSGTGMILLKVSGKGKLLAACYGAIEERQIGPGERYTIDTGHIVGFDGGMPFQVQKVGSWKSTLLGGEGLVCQLSGPGRVLIQTRSEEAFLGWLLPNLPQRSN